MKFGTNTQSINDVSLWNLFRAYWMKIILTYKAGSLIDIHVMLL